MDNTELRETFQNCCDMVLKHCKDEYAKAYARQGMYLEGRQAIKTQAAFILTNTQYWRGDIAKHTKATLKVISRIDWMQGEGN